jgi:thymidylate synthase
MKYRHEDGTPFSKEEFQQKLKTDKEFNDEFGNKGIDQISELIKQLKENPDSRRLLVSAWNISDLPHQVLPPCHYGFQVYTREMTLEERLEWNHQNSDPLNRSLDYFPEHLDSMNVPKRKISLSFNQRSIDTLLGLPFNIASYGLLLEIIAKEVNMVPDELIGNLGDTHLYLNHITQAKEQVKREPYRLPKLEISRTLFEFGKPDPNKLDLDYYSIHNFELLNYQSHPTIKAPLSN